MTTTDMRTVGTHEHEVSPMPLPVRRGGRRRPPLEARTDWDPWLPATEAYPDVPRALRSVALVVLTLAVLLLALLLFAPMAF
jgi:hypothetical protein